MSFGLPSGNEIIRIGKDTFLRFPLSMISSILASLVSICLIETGPRILEGSHLEFAKVLLASSLGFFVFAAQELMGEQLGKVWQRVWMSMAIAGILLYYYLLPSNEKEFSVFIVYFRHLFLSLLFFISMLWTPFIKRDLSNENYWEYAKGVLFSVVMTFLFTGIVILGVNGALFAVEKLFGAHIQSKLYSQVDVLIMGVFSTGYLLSQIPIHPEESRFGSTPPKVEIFFTKWLLTPLSILYFVILYAYTLKLLIVQDWPKGILASLIVVFSMVAILTYLFWTHFVKEQNRGWRRVIWVVVLLQTIMLFVAIWMRISAYSWTESRYMIFFLGVWLLGISLYFLIYPRAKIKWIFISLSLLIALSQIGPLSAYTLSRRAQESRLKKMVEKIKEYHPASKAPRKLRYEISDGIEYLYIRYKEKSLSKIFPKSVEDFYLEKRVSANPDKNHHSTREPSTLGEYITDRLGFRFINGWEYRDLGKDGGETVVFAVDKKMESGARTMTNVNGYRYIAHIGKGGYAMFDAKRELADVLWKYEEPHLTLTYTKEFKLVVSSDRDKVVFDLYEHFSKLAAKYGNISADPETADMRLQKKVGSLKVKLEMDSLIREKIMGVEVISFNGVLFAGGSI